MTIGSSETAVLMVANMMSVIDGKCMTWLIIRVCAGIDKRKYVKVGGLHDLFQEILHVTSEGC
jgi:hypothetical protein